MEHPKLAVIVGAGPGLGRALARRFGAAEMNVALAARDLGRLENLSVECAGIGRGARAYACDATREDDVEAFFEQVRADYGDPDVVVYNAGAYVQRSLLETTVHEFESCWRTGCLGGFLVGRAAARAMLARLDQGGPGGTILFTGATASLRGSAGFHNLAVGKFGLRALAQSMARELHPLGIHVCHVVIDGRIRPPAVVEHVGCAHGQELLEPEAIAEAYFELHRQAPCAWTHEMDLRPSVEKF